MHLFSGLSNFEPPQIKVKGKPGLDREHARETRADLQEQQRELHAELVRRYVAGETVKALAAENGLHHQSVRAVLVQSGAIVRTRQRLSEDDLGEIVRLYTAGLTTAEIGERFGVYASTIGRQLKKLGVELRAPGWRPSDQQS